MSQTASDNPPRADGSPSVTGLSRAGEQAVVVPSSTERALAAAFETPIQSLREAEARITRLKSADVILRLKMGEIYCHIRNNALYREDGYETWDEYLAYSPAVKFDPGQVRVLMQLHEVFIATLKLSPEEIQKNAISFTHLTTILPYVERQMDPEGSLVIFNREQVLSFLNAAQTLSARELRNRIRDELHPGEVQAYFRILRVETIGRHCLVEWEEISNGEFTKCGLTKFTQAGFQRFRQALQNAGCLIQNEAALPSHHQVVSVPPLAVPTEIANGRADA